MYPLELQGVLGRWRRQLWLPEGRRAGGGVDAGPPPGPLPLALPSQTGGLGPLWRRDGRQQLPLEEVGTGAASRGLGRAREC